MLSHKTRVAVVLVAVVFWTALGSAQTSISADEAKNHVGERATVCRQVASTHYAARSRGNPTFIKSRQAIPKRDFHRPDLGK